MVISFFLFYINKINMSELIIWLKKSNNLTYFQIPQNAKFIAIPKILKTLFYIIFIKGVGGGWAEASKSRGVGWWMLISNDGIKEMVRFVFGCLWKLKLRRERKKKWLFLLREKNIYIFTFFLLRQNCLEKSNKFFNKHF